MKRSPIPIKYLIAAFLILGAHVALGSFIGSVDEKGSKYSLKNLNKSFFKNYSLASLKSSAYRFKGSQILNSRKDIKNNSLEVKSVMRFENGNTAYVFPYKYRVKVSKFITPSPQR